MPPTTHTLSETQRLVEAINAAFGQIGGELYAKMGGDPAVLSYAGALADPATFPARHAASETAIRRSPLYPLWHGVVSPAWSEWAAFYDSHARGTYGEHLASWDDFQRWADRAVKLHAYAAAEIPRLVPGERLAVTPPGEMFAFLVSGTAGERTPIMTKLDLLTEIVNQHGHFFAQVARENPTDLFRTFIVSRWEPFVHEWSYVARHAPYAASADPQSADSIVETAVASAAHKLSELRELARANYIPVPDLDAIAAAARGGQPAVAGALTIRHTPQGQVVITHDLNGHMQPQVGGPHHHGGGGGGGGWHGGSRNFDMGWRGGGWGWGWPYGYDYAYPVVAVPPGCFVDAYGQVVCPQVAVAGWLDDIGNAVSNTVKSAASGISHVASSAIGTVGHTLAHFKGPIAAAAGLAAAAAAASIPVAGPLVAPMASGLAHSLVDAAAGSGDVKAAAVQVVAQAAQTAQTDPHVATALVAAQQAVTKAATGFHTAAQVAQAAQGDAQAAARLAEMVNAAAAGDPQAIAAMNLTQGAVLAQAD